MLHDLKYDDRINSIEWYTDSSFDYINLKANENGYVILNTIRALLTKPLKRDTIVIPCIDQTTNAVIVKQIKGWRIGASDITLVKHPTGYTVTHRPTGKTIVHGLYKTRIQALDQIPRAVVTLTRARNTIRHEKTLNY